MDTSASVDNSRVARPPSELYAPFAFRYIPRQNNEYRPPHSRHGAGGIRGGSVAALWRVPERYVPDAFPVHTAGLPVCTGIKITNIPGYNRLTTG